LLSSVLASTIVHRSVGTLQVFRIVTMRTFSRSPWSLRRACQLRVTRDKLILPIIRLKALCKARVDTLTHLSSSHRLPRCSPRVRPVCRLRRQHLRKPRHQSLCRPDHHFQCRSRQVALQTPPQQQRADLPRHTQECRAVPPRTASTSTSHLPPEPATLYRPRPGETT
jgi:hypothetical protein